MSLPLIPLGLLGQGGTLAFPTLRATENYIDTAFADDHDVDLPARTTTGDLVLMFGYFASLTGADTVDITVPSGWTRLALLDSGTAAEVAVYARIAAGPMSSVNLAKSGSGDAFTARTNSYSFSAHSHVFPSLLPEVSSISSQTTDSPNPPSLALPGTWGAAPHTTWLSCVFKFGTNTTSAVSASYSNLVTTGDNANRMMSARRNLIATSENPGAWTTSASSAAFAFTIGVRGPE
jgi:hypothetical protein